MGVLSNIATVLIAIVALIAGWIRCISDVPNLQSRLFRIPHIGQYLARVNWSGWVVAVLIVVLTAINLVSSEFEKQELKSSLKALHGATEKISSSTKDIQAATDTVDENLASSIQTLGNHSETLTALLENAAASTLADTRIHTFEFYYLLDFPRAMTSQKDLDVRIRFINGIADPVVFQAYPTTKDGSDDVWQTAIKTSYRGREVPVIERGYIQDAESFRHRAQLLSWNPHNAGFAFWVNNEEAKQNTLRSNLPENASDRMRPTYATWPLGQYGDLRGTSIEIQATGLHDDSLKEVHIILNGTHRIALLLETAEEADKEGYRKVIENAFTQIQVHAGFDD